MASGESKGSHRYDKENLLWQSTVAIKSVWYYITALSSGEQYNTKQTLGHCALRSER